ncbi:MAG: NrsF family protein, partial [Myxococcota bacterium]
MSVQSTEDRIHDLVRDLRPVRPIPPLRAAGAAVVGIFLLIVAGDWLLGGFSPRPGGDTAWSSPSYLAALFGLVLVAIGATSAALASAVPGREGAVRLGVRAGALGLLVAVAGGLWGLARSDLQFSTQELAACASCMSRSVQLGIASTVLACAYIVHAAMRRPSAGAALALIGGVALGAAAVHTTCPSDSALHQLVAHTLAPLVAAALLTLPLAALLRRLWGRARESAR